MPKKIEWMPYEEARTFMRSLKLKSKNDWVTYYKSANNLPHSLPKNPWKAYKDNGWVSYGDYLGTFTEQTQKRSYLPFIEARAFVHNLKFESTAKWREYAKSKHKPKKNSSRTWQSLQRQWLG